MKWQAGTSDNPILWLLERENPAVRFGIPQTTLEYPYFGYGLFGTPDALARLGHAAQEPKIAAAIECPLSRKLPEGTWPLDQSPHRIPFNMGQPGEPNKWLTLDALRVIKLLNKQA